MRTNLKIGLATRLSEAEAQQCSRLCFGKQGSMFWRLRGIRNSDERAHVLRLFDEDAKLLAWGLVFDENSWTEDPDQEVLAIYVYTRSSHRRRGYGRRIVDAATRRFGELVVYPHDKASKNFFNSLSDVLTPVDSDEYELYKEDA